MVEKADGGTLFLDEIGDLGPEAQAKLLRFLEAGDYYRIGGTNKRKVRTRIVSATNKNLKELISAGSFRKDLYFRLAVVKIEVPTLNHRKEDIPAIADHFLSEYSKKFGKKVTSLSKSAKEALKTYRWSGHIRELKNIIERAVLLADGTEIKFKHLGFEDGGNKFFSVELEKGVILPSIPPEGMDYKEVMASIEKHFIKEAFCLAKKNESKAARLLKVSRDIFRYKRRKLCASDLNKAY